MLLKGQGKWNKKHDDVRIVCQVIDYQLVMNYMGLFIFLGSSLGNSSFHVLDISGNFESDFMYIIFISFLWLGNKYIKTSPQHQI